MLLQGINFQGTVGFATPQGNETTEIANSVNYPRTSPQGLSIGWVTEAVAINAQNDNAGVDRRLAGTAWWDAGTGENIYGIDVLTTGALDIDLGKGEVGFAFPATTVALYDDTTFNVTLSTGSTSDGQFRDATDVLHTNAANWSSNHNLRAVTTTDTKLRFRISRSSGEGGVAYIGVEGPDYTIDLKAFRSYADGSESASVALAAQNAIGEVEKAEIFQIRTGGQATLTPPPMTRTIRYRKVGDTAWRTIGAAP